MWKQPLVVGKKTVLAIAVGTFTVMAGAGAALGTLDVFGSEVLAQPFAAAIAAGGFALTSAGTGSQNGESALQGTLQAIAPMSRNLRAEVLGSHPEWAPVVQQIVALDGVVIVEKNGAGACARDPEG